MRPWLLSTIVRKEQVVFCCACFCCRYYFDKLWDWRVAKFRFFSVSFFASICLLSATPVASKYIQSTHAVVQQHGVVLFIFGRKTLCLRQLHLQETGSTPKLSHSEKWDDDVNSGLKLGFGCDITSRHLCQCKVFQDTQLDDDCSVFSGET
jgi:hypothetical protein